MSNSNPILSGLAFKRATPEEKLDAWQTIRDDPAVRRLLGMPEEEAPPLMLMGETIDKAKTQIAQEGQVIGVATGFRSLDDNLKGLRGGEMIVVFGDTAHGKSQLCQNIALNVALKAKPVLFVGLEMSNVENTVRFMQMFTGPPDELYALPILYPQVGDLGYKQIDGLVKAAVAEGTALVVIDHLHMLTRDVSNLANEISLICHELKRVARTYDVPVMVVSHINREGAKAKRVPDLADLKGSGSIGQDADIALAVWRDTNEESELHQSMVVRCRKHRRGKRFKIELSILPNARLGEVIMDIYPS